MRNPAVALAFIFLILFVAQPQKSFGANVPMPADKSVAMPADPEPAAESGAPAGGSGSAAASGSAPAGESKQYQEAALKHYNRGVELHQAGFLNQAIAEYRAAIESDPRIEEAWSNLGGIYAAQRSYPKAMEAFEKALSIKPDRPTTLNGYGTVLYARGKIAEAKEKWQQAVTIDPGFASAYYNMANALEGDKESRNALAYYYLAIQANPNMADAYYRMGNIYFKQNLYAVTKVLLQKAMDLSPDAEFVKEAKKEMDTINSALAADKSDKQDVQTNVVSPTTTTQNQVDRPRETASAPTKHAKEHHGLFSGGGGGGDSKTKKKKKQKNADMFVQTSQTKPTDTDLTEKPAE